MIDESDLNNTDRRLIEILTDGRVTPQYVAGMLDISRTYASERLKRLVEHGHVEKLASGLYELVDDPRDGAAGTTDSSSQTRLQEAKKARTEAEARADRLETELEECREQLKMAPSSDVDRAAIHRAIETLEAACERGDGAAIQNALNRLRDVVDQQGE